ncbi:MAG: tRNA (cytidine(56)-2'-O)-methyltransferase [Nanoarchaeota archaeon]|nr:tRNA (cytidine(56)-2'-O)-methyltransferase [Nanoarchaeota archaeon]
MLVKVLRLGHRVGRDKRATTHLFLAARAFGAVEGFLSGETDSNLTNSVNSLSNSWGGDFKVSYVKNWRKLVREFNGKIVHLTMYGIPVQNCVKKIGAGSDLLVIVGGAKVPSDVYELADYNVSITTQPHSEIAALSVFLDKLFDGKELLLKFPNAQKKIVPKKNGKKVLKYSEK